MDISIFGLGYVGCVSAACWADEGHRVVGVDVNPLKVAMINEGQSPIVERGLGEMLQRSVSLGRLYATTDPIQAVQSTDLSFICVGTPSCRNGSLDLSAIQHVCRDLGRGLRQKNEPHLVVLRSTVLPGTLEEVAVPILEETSHRRVDVDFSVASNPEFLREGTSIEDFRHPPLTLIGARQSVVSRTVASLYKHLQAPIVETSIRVAEMVKYVNNCFHALKVGFANEIGNLCQAFGIDSHEVMDIFCRDHKLNISPTYLKPGFAFGGSCLTKDLRAVTRRARELDIPTPILEAIMPSNELQIRKGLEMVLDTGRRNVGILGLSFKSGTDDLRGSPHVVLIEGLIGKGLNVRIYDRYVVTARLLGANKAYIEERIPHIANLMYEDIEQVIDESDVIVVGNRDEEFVGALARIGSRDKIVIDLARVLPDFKRDRRYRGICW